MRMQGLAFRKVRRWRAASGARSFASFPWRGRGRVCRAAFQRARDCRLGTEADSRRANLGIEIGALVFYVGHDGVDVHGLVLLVAARLRARLRARLHLVAQMM